MNRLILHCDLNNFYASVECMLKPALAGVPLVVAGNPKARHGVVLAKNDLAKQAGIKTGDTIWEAQRKSPGLTVVAPQFELYTKYSKLAKQIYDRYTPLVEPFGADECWLDCTGSMRFADSKTAQSSSLFAGGQSIADSIRSALKVELGLTASVGISFNKVFAKLGSDLKKPDATTVISLENFKRVVYPLPVGELFMVGRKTTEKLARFNIRTIGDLANADERILKENFGINGIKLKQSAQGLDDEPVREAVVARQNKSFGHGMTTTRNVTDFESLDTLLYYLSERVATRMRKAGIRGTGVAVDLRSFELKHAVKQRKLTTAIRSSVEIANAAATLCREIWDGTLPLRTVTVSVFDLSPNHTDNGQVSMFESHPGTLDNLDLALEKIRSKYGANSILRADLIERDFIYDKTDDEDFLPFQR